MARSKFNPATSVTFRMPDDILEILDKLALGNGHDRTAEINEACRHWIDIGGASGNETLTQQKVSALGEELACMNARLEKQEEAILLLKETIDRLEKNNSTLLAVIESNEHTIKRLLETISRQQ